MTSNLSKKDIEQIREQSKEVIKSTELDIERLEGHIRQCNIHIATAKAIVKSVK